ncbi:MAG: HAMP domain-containing protein, partial [Clostridia bacterium]|nr:HAMP domain-containing protein [Clostridia bacterium]
MKKRSIRFKLTLWFSLAQIAVVAITLAAVLGASQTVLRSTVRNYLIGTVEENVDSIDYVSAKEDLPDYIYVPYHDGYLKIDPGYMDVVNDVETALYSKDGTMLYGSNPLAIQTEGTAFSESYTWSLKVDGIRYDLYDRKVNLENLTDGELWVRGVVPETRNTAQLNEIARLSALLLPLLLLLSLLSGWFLADRLLAPVRKIQQTAEQIAEDNDLTRRIETVTTKDEVGKLATVFNRMLDRLQHSFDSERQFTSDASHELRTPTSVILAQTDYILEKDRPAEEYKEALEVVQKQGRKMNTLIADMLD